MGQAKRKGRICPAIDTVILPAECGDKRVSRIACREDCPHNPWRADAYAQALQVEDAVYARLRSRLQQESQAEPGYRSIPQVQQDYGQAYFFTRDGNGLTLFGRWEQAGFAGLTNDQVVFLRALAAQHAGVLEILEVRGEEEVLACDRLDLERGPFVIHDRRLAQMAGRFTCLLACLVDMPHYARVTGIALVVPRLSGLEAEVVVREVIAHLGGPKDARARNEWLLTHLSDCNGSFAAIQDAVQEAMFKNASYTRAWYRIADPGYDFVSAMGRCHDVVPDTVKDDLNEGMTHEWTWLSDADPVAPDTKPTLGRVLYGNGRIRLEAGGVERGRKLRDALEGLHRDRVRFEQQRVDDLGAQMRAKQGKKADPALFPPALSQHLPSMEFTISLVKSDAKGSAGAKTREWIESKSDRWCDESVPGLDGKTPRQAAIDATLRPKLVTMVKHMIAQADRAGLDSGRFHDESSIVKTLGLSEIDYPVPPRLREPGGVDEGDEDDAIDPRPLSPFLPAESLDYAEVKRRAAHALACFEDLDDMMASFEEEEPDLADWVMDWGADSLKEYEQDVLFHLASLLWYIVYPPETQGRGVDLDRMDGARKFLLEWMSKSGESRMFDDLMSPEQPAMTEFCQELIFKLASRGKDAERLSAYASMSATLLCRVLTDELAQSARGS